MPQPPAKRRNVDAELARLRRDVIGADAMVEGPFGPRPLVYADHIASGRPLASIEAALVNAVLPTYANTHTEDSATGARTTRLAHGAAARIKECLGADARYAVAFPGTGATGAIKRLQEILGVAVGCGHREAVLNTLPSERRLVVFVGPYEHHSNEVSWRESLAEVRVVPLADDGALDLAALERMVADPALAERPKLGCFSAASNVTGILTDVPAVASILRRGGAKVAFDYAASAPYEAIDVRPGSDAQIDAVMASPHKLLGGPGSPGLLLFHRDLYALRAPTTAGGGTVSYVGPDEHRFLGDVEAREDAGTPAILQRMRAAAAFALKERIGTATIKEREERFTERALPRLRSHPRVRLLGPERAPRLAIASFLLRDPSGPPGREVWQHPRLTVRLLSDLFGIQGRAGCSCAGPYGHALLGIDRTVSGAYLQAIEAGYEGIKPGWARISFHWLADEQEIDYLVDAVRFLADYGHRFRVLYDFCWRSGAWCWRGGALARELGLDARPEPVGEEVHEEPFDLLALTAPRRLARDLDEERKDAFRQAHRYAQALADAPVEAPVRPAEIDPSLVFFRAG